MTKNIGFILCLLIFIGCESDSDVNEQNTGNLNLIFHNTVGANEFVLSNATYANSHNESFTVNELKYIISNISLLQDNGNTYTIPIADSYFVIDASSTLSALLIDIPVGNYTEIQFGFGVDPTQYPIESGTLNFVPTAEEAGMLWSWSAGYKFLKFEGNYSTTADITENQPFNYHVGSHGATLDNYKEITLAFAKAVTQNNTEHLTINFDVSKIFDSTYSLSLSEKDDIQVDPINAPKIAENIRTAFSIE